MDYDRSIIGTVLEESEPLAVTAESIADFCRVTGETNPWYTDEEAARQGPFKGLVAPPALVLTFRNNRRFASQIFVDDKNRRGLDAGRDVEFVAPLRPGDQVRLTSVVKDMYEKTGRTGTMLFIIVQTTVFNQQQQVVARIDHRFMRR